MTFSVPPESGPDVNSVKRGLGVVPLPGRPQTPGESILEQPGIKAGIKAQL